MFYELRFKEGDAIQALVGEYGVYLHEVGSNFWFCAKGKDIEVALDEYVNLFEGTLEPVEIREMGIIKSHGTN